MWAGEASVPLLRVALLSDTNEVINWNSVSECAIAPVATPGPAGSMFILRCQIELIDFGT